MPVQPAALRRDYRLHVQIGAVFALLLTLAAFSVPTPPEPPPEIVEIPDDPLVLMEIPPSNITPPPPPPPPAPPPPVEVENDKEILNEVVPPMEMTDWIETVPSGPPAPPAPPPAPPKETTAPPPPPEAFDDNEILDFVPVQNQPVLIGGLEGLQKRVVYPEVAQRVGASGTVYIRFVVDENGRVVDPEVVRSPNQALSQAALTAVRESEFVPGTQRGRAVKVRYTLPIQFVLR